MLSDRIVKAREYAQAIREVQNPSNPMLDKNYTDPTKGKTLQYTPATAAKSGASDAAAALKANLAANLQAIKQSADSQQAAWGYYNQALRNVYAAGEIDLATYNASQINAVRTSTRQRVQALQEQIGALQSAQGSMPKAADKIAAQSQINSLVSQQVQIEAQASQQLVLFAQQQAAAMQQAQQQVHGMNAALLDLQGNAQAAAKIRLGDQYAGWTKALDQAGAGSGMADQLRAATALQIDFQSAQQAMQGVLIDLATHQQNLNSLQESGAINGLQYSVQEHASRMQSAADLQSIVQQMQTLAVISGNADMARAAKKAAADLQSLQAQMSQTSQEVSGIMDSNFASAFRSFIDGTESAGSAFKKMIAGILEDLAVLIAQKALSNAFSSSGGWVGSLVGIVAGAKANGGPVSGGSAYLVGERGPELFVPGGSGAIVPNHALQGAGGGGSVSVMVNVDAGSVSTQSNQPDLSQMGAMIGNVVLAKIAEQKRPGGLLAKAA
jgi:hypothetical protein